MFRRLRSFSNFGSAPLVVWLFIQLAMTGAFFPAGASSPETVTDDGFANSIIICTGTGFKRISLNEDGSLPTDTNEVDNYCPWCLHFANLPPLAAPNDWQPVSLSASKEVVWFSGENTWVTQIPCAHFNSRAPPF